MTAHLWAVFFRRRPSVGSRIDAGVNDAVSFNEDAQSATTTRSDHGLINVDIYRKRTLFGPNTCLTVEKFYFTGDERY
jgi:hypothetical protein